VFSQKTKLIEKEQLGDLSSQTKIWNQLIIFIIIGILPLIFPQYISVPNHKIILINLGIALITSFIYEVIRKKRAREGKETQAIMKVQLLTSVILLTIFLHFFGRINGPLFILYLLTIMESSLNLNVSAPNLVVAIMLSATIIEFIYLALVGEIVLSLTSLVEVIMRVVSLIFMRSYGLSLAQRIILEERSRERLARSARELKRASRRLKKANLRLRELSSLKDEFVSVVSHQLRTPMTAIKSYLWLVLNKSKDKLSPKTRRDLERAYQSVERTIFLVKDMLTVSRIEGKRLDIVPVRTDLCQLARRVADDLKVKADQKGINLTVSKPNRSLYVEADPDKIGQVFQNLIDNAIKFTPKGGKVVISFKETGGRVEASVSDTGPGIPKESMPRLFKKFSRVEHSFSEMAETPGTGLGLYIAKQLVSLHKGEIWVESKVGKGSTFTFSLPKGKGGRKNEKKENPRH